MTAAETLSNYIPHNIGTQSDDERIRPEIVKAMQEFASSKEARIKELTALLSRVLYWDNGDLPENAIREIKAALNPPKP